jgi:hypothetical protein
VERKLKGLAFEIAKQGFPFSLQSKSSYEEDLIKDDIDYDGPVMLSGIFTATSSEVEVTVF